MSPRAIQQAPFRVLVGANMPAVLVEMGFISNPEQEKQLASDAFQKNARAGARRQPDRVSRLASRRARRRLRRHPAALERGDAAACSRPPQRLPLWPSPAAGCSSSDCHAGLAGDGGSRTPAPAASAPAAPSAKSRRRCITSPRTVYRSSACSAKSRSANRSTNRRAGSSKRSFGAHRRRSLLPSRKARRCDRCS